MIFYSWSPENRRFFFSLFLFFWVLKKKKKKGHGWYGKRKEIFELVKNFSLVSIFQVLENLDLINSFELVKAFSLVSIFQVLENLDFINSTS